MTKKRSILFTALVLVFTLALTCGLVACNAKKEKHTITWDYDSAAVTVTASGYEELPTELEEEAEVSFTVAVNNGYELDSVSGAKKQDDGSYKLTMGNKDVTVKISVSKILNDITVEVLKTDVVYYEDDSVGADDIKVTANYALGDEVLTASQYTVKYPVYHTSINEETGEEEKTATFDNVFSEGSTSFIVSFEGKEKEIELDYTVTTSVRFTSAKLELNSEQNGVVVVMKGVYVANGDAQKYVEGFINNCQEGNTWSNMDYEQAVTVDEEKDQDGHTTFTLNLTVSGMLPENYYFFHVRGGANGQNLTCTNVSATGTLVGTGNNFTIEKIEGQNPVTVDGIEYYLANCEQWVPATMMIFVHDPVAPVLNFTTARLEQNSDKVYIVLEGTFDKYTEEELETLRYNCNTTSSEYVEVERVEVVDDAFTLYFDITAVENYGEWWWAKWTINGNNTADDMKDIKCSELPENGSETKDEYLVGERITLNGKTYSLYSMWNMPVLVVTQE